MKDNTLLVEKYRPTVLQDYVGNENVKETIQKYLDQMPNESPPVAITVVVRRKLLEKTAPKVVES